MSQSNRLIVAMLLIAAGAAAFWMLLLSPKREESKELSREITQLEQTLDQHELEVVQALAARREFPADYRRLVVMGKAVPGDDDTASLMVQLSRISGRADIRFEKIALESSGTPASTTPPAGSTTETQVSATEVAAATMPLGAKVGPAGLAVMPYSLKFKGRFFEIADFIKGLDALVDSKDTEVAVDGRLITIDGFTLKADKNRGFPALEAEFDIRTYLTPPSEGVTGGASPESPSSSATPAATTIGGTP